MAARLDGFDGVVLAAAAVDTVKEAEAGIIKKTLPRDRVWLAQTPQLFRFDVLKKAHDGAADFAATDDAALVELMGRRVAIFPNERDNFKVTTETDLKMAEAVLSARRAGDSQ